MDVDRRAELVAHGLDVLPLVQAAVVDSWADLLPESATWRPEALERAVAASDTAVAGLVRMIAAGDLDEGVWHGIRQAVLPHGHGIASNLLRVVAIVGIETLADHFSAHAGLTAEERWQLHQEASTFAQHVLGRSDEHDASAEQALLSELHRGGVDLR